jgi:hypothetical protein
MIRPTVIALALCVVSSAQSMPRSGLREPVESAHFCCRFPILPPSVKLSSSHASQRAALEGARLTEFPITDELIPCERL